ncbi:MAG: aminodeoxychorismate synthase component I [Planctomycetota bacterium]|nr:aminodeoxychorismate synthase component I [Planctomycetota bacterium]
MFSEPQAEICLAPSQWLGAWDRLAEFLETHAGRPCVGYLGYDLRDDVEQLDRRVADDFPWPCLRFTAFDRVEEWQGATPLEPPSVAAARDLRSHTSRSDYEARVAAVVEHIRAGDIFQANLTQPFTADFDDDPRKLFWKLCHTSPAPFAAYYEAANGEAVLCSSPEEFLLVEGDRVRTRPIKGTRPRGATPEADAALLQELLASEKDRAELAMIVDLLRNDLGKVATAGSVRVGSFPEHASYAQVHHTQAEVTAKLRPGVSMVDILRATFPGGSITGAPKLRAMEVIESLELCRRGVYTGAIGWIGPGPQMHLNVAIRTMVCRDGRVRFNTGGGITADSDPAAEFEETLHKAFGMVSALGCELHIVDDACPE